MRILLSVLLFSCSAALAQPAPWVLDTGKSELVVKVWKTGAAAGLAHDHVVRASKFEGKVVDLDDSGKIETLALELKVDVAGLVPDEPEVRKRYGVTGPAVPDSDREKVKENMLGAEQLDLKRFPTMSFRSTRVYREESGVIECEGDLTMHGVTKPVVFPLTVKTGDRLMEGDAKFRVRTSDFGVKPYSAALGLIKNRDEVEFVLHVVVSR
ncbi:MAG: YceI family protein [Myxococcaceae bacterium]